MHSNESLIREFYEAFDKKDFKRMQEAYHASATFSDAVFGTLSSAEVKAMWKMLVVSAKDLKVRFGEVKADEQRGECRWEAWYTYTATGRPVHNVIRARFEFRDGKIFGHEDQFNFWRWARMALGTTGLLMGWSPFLTNTVRRIARSRLQRFMKNEALLDQSH